MTSALAAPNPSDSFERERSGRVLLWSRIAPAREELRNASNKSEHEPTSDHSTNYGNGHLIRVFRDIGRIFSWLLPCTWLLLGPSTPSPVRHRLQRYCSKLKPKCGFVQRKYVSNEFRDPESEMTKVPHSHGPQMHLRGNERGARLTIRRGDRGQRKRHRHIRKKPRPCSPTIDRGLGATPAGDPSYVNPNLDNRDPKAPGGPGMNPSHHGGDEQMFGAEQQVLRRAAR